MKTRPSLLSTGEPPRFQSLRRGAYQQTSTQYTDQSAQQSGAVSVNFGKDSSKMILLATLNETERRKLRRNFKVKNSTETGYHPLSPYSVDQNGFATLNPIHGRMETIPDA